MANSSGGPAKSLDEYNGVQKAAILMIALGPERSSKLFEHLKDEEIEALTLEIANTKSVDQETKDAVIDEFYQLCLAQQYIAEGGIGYAKELLEKALGTDRAVDHFTVLEEKEGRNIHDPEAHCDVFAVIDVALDDRNLISHLDFNLVEDRGDHAAGAAPDSPEVYDNKLVILEQLVKSGIGCNISHSIRFFIRANI